MITTEQFMTQTNNLAQSLGYASTVEKVHSIEHPEVKEWMSYFQKKIVESKIFQDFNDRTAKFGNAKAAVVANQWYQFSKFVPWLLCFAASRMSSNEKRHYVIQTAFEELGMRNVEEIHADLFKQAAESLSIKINQQENYENLDAGEPIAYLANAVKNCKNESVVLGMLLGLEGPARENIETIFESMDYLSNEEVQLEKNVFFVLHRQIEIEHIRLTVANFLKFCFSPTQKEDFICGFEEGLTFWKMFWTKTSELIQLESV